MLSFIIHFRHHQVYNADDAVHELDVVATKWIVCCLRTSGPVPSALHIGHIQLHYGHGDRSRPAAKTMAAQGKEWTIDRAQPWFPIPTALPIHDSQPETRSIKQQQ